MALRRTEHVDILEFLTDPSGLSLCSLPRAGHVEHLGAMDTTYPRKEHGGRKSVQPPLCGLDPFRGPANVHQFVKGGHEVAVDIPGPIRDEIVREHGHHRFVQKCHAVAHLPSSDECSSLERGPHGDEVGVVEPPAHFTRPLGPLDDRIEISLVESALEVEIDEVTVLYPLRLVTEQPLCTAH